MSTHIAKQHIFSMSPSIIALNLNKLKGRFFGFCGAKIGYFEGWNQVQIVLGSTHIVQQLLLFCFFQFWHFSSYKMKAIQVNSKKPPNAHNVLTHPNQNDSQKWPKKAQNYSKKYKKSSKMKVISSDTKPKWFQNLQKVWKQPTLSLNSTSTTNPTSTKSESQPQFNLSPNSTLAPNQP